MGPGRPHCSRHMTTEEVYWAEIGRAGGHPLNCLTGERFWILNSPSWFMRTLKIPKFKV